MGCFGETVLCLLSQFLLKSYVTVYPGLETNARPRLVRFRPGEWLVPPDQPGGRVDFILFFFYFFRITIIS